MALKKLPIGIDGFEKIITNNFYYADKTMFIAELLNNWGEVNLFTRPRRFGKSLNMSMLKSFFEIGSDGALFEGLNIAQEAELCCEYMGKFPVIYITLKGVDGASFSAAKEILRFVTGVEAGRFSFLADSDKLTEAQKMSYRALVEVNADGNYSMSDTALEHSLLTLTSLLWKHYGTKVIVLIDEYDVPLDKAFQSGFYDEMLQLLRNFLGNVLKTNDSLQFAVLTGCLRISKESIFTGLNNLRVNTITDALYDEYFGFTDADVKKLLEYYRLSAHYDQIKEWYDGYRFGNVGVYCPWDVINYCFDARADACTEPRNYWANTSGNNMVRRFIDLANQQTRKEIELLIAGDSITKNINMELTYNELDSSVDNLWSVLFTTGYLTQRGRMEGKGFSLAIPNREIQELFVSQIRVWFQEYTRADAPRIEKFCLSFPEANAEVIEELLNDYLWNSIGIRDTAVRSNLKENFYHGMLLGLLQYEDSWIIKSNTESGEGFSDILIETPNRTGVVIEVKYVEAENLDKGCAEAIAQIEKKNYASRLIDDGMMTVIKYGIAFYKKRCRVRLG